MLQVPEVFMDTFESVYDSGASASDASNSLTHKYDNFVNGYILLFDRISSCFAPAEASVTSPPGKWRFALATNAIDGK